MSKLAVRRLIWVGVAIGLAAAGTAGAFLLRSRRDVTTSSEEAYRWYVKGRDNQLKLYEREAVQAYAEALKHDPHFVMATVRLAAYQGQRDPERARSLIEAAKKRLDDVTPAEALAVGIVEAQLARDDKKVESLLDELGRRYPQEPETYQLRAGLLMKRGKPNEAAAEYERLIAIDPNYAIAYNSLGYHWASMGDFAKAEDYLKRYRFLASDQANPYDSLGELYANIGRYDEAQASFEKALKIKPDFVPSVAHLGTLAALQGRYADAAASFLKAIEMSEGGKGPSDWWTAAALLLARSGRADEGRAIYEKGFAQERPSDPASVLKLEARRAGALARIEIFAGRLDEAEVQLQKAREAVEKMPASDRKDWTMALDVVAGLVLQARGDHEAAADALRKGLEGRVEQLYDGFAYYPSTAFARVARAECLLALGRVEEAGEALRPVIARNPKFAAAVPVLARLKEEGWSDTAKRPAPEAVAAGADAPAPEAAGR